MDHEVRRFGTVLQVAAAVVRDRCPQELSQLGALWHAWKRWQASGQCNAMPPNNAMGAVGGAVPSYAYQVLIAADLLVHNHLGEDWHADAATVDRVVKAMASALGFRSTGHRHALLRLVQVTLSEVEAAKVVGTIDVKPTGANDHVPASGQTSELVLAGKRYCILGGQLGPPLNDILKRDSNIIDKVRSQVICIRGGVWKHKSFDDLKPEVKPRVFRTIGKGETSFDRIARLVFGGRQSRIYSNDPVLRDALDYDDTPGTDEQSKRALADWAWAINSLIGAVESGSIMVVTPRILAGFENAPSVWTDDYFVQSSSAVISVDNGLRTCVDRSTMRGGSGVGHERSP